MVVIHYTAMDSADAACRTLCNPANEVSAHYLIDEDGTVRFLVAEDMRAWHAGAGQWGALTDINSRSIGIELSNVGTVPFAKPQMAALISLLKGIRDRWSIAPHRVIGHSDMAPGRKIDPGYWFDWQRLARDGLSVWPEQRPDRGYPVDFKLFRAAAERFGYRCNDDDLLLNVVRMRFRPRVKGPVDSIDLAMITDLAERFSVDARTATS